MLLKSRNDDVDDDASIKSFGDCNGRRVSSLSAFTASWLNRASAHIDVPIAVPPRFISYSWSTFRCMNARSASSVDANE